MIFERLGIGKIEYKNSSPGNAKIIFENQEIGTIGKISPAICERFGISSEVFASELNFDIIKENTLVKKYVPVGLYPPIIEDLSFKRAPNIQTGDLINEIKNSDLLVKDVFLLDTFNDKITFRVYYQSNERNLTDKDSQKIRNKILKNLESKYKVFLIR